MMEIENKEIEEFTQRCMLLEMNFNVLLTKETSPRVWVSVIASTFTALTFMCDDPDGAHEQLLSVLKERFEEEKVNAHNHKD